MSTEHQSDEITLKELILSIQDYGREIIRKWWIVGIITALSVGYFLYKHYTHVVTYPYEIKFMVEGESGQAQIGGLLGQFGLGKQNANPIKIQEVARSNSLFEKIAFTPMQSKTIANTIFDIYNLEEKWSKTNPNFEGYNFKNQLANAEALDKLAFKKLEGFVWKGFGNSEKPLLNISYNFDDGIFRLKSNSEDPDLSRNLANVLYNNVADFFENEILKNKTKALLVLESRVDSLEVLRINKNMELARFDDQSIAVISSRYKSKRNILQQDLIAISGSYAEVLKNKELAEFNLNSSKALFLQIDKTLEPVGGSRSSIKKKLIVGVGLGIFLAILFISIRKLIQDIFK